MEEPNDRKALTSDHRFLYNYVEVTSRRLLKKDLADFICRHFKVCSDVSDVS